MAIIKVETNNNVATGTVAKPKKTKVQKETVSVYFPLDVFQELEEYCFQNRERSLSPVVVRIVEDFLKRAKK